MVPHLNGTSGARPNAASRTASWARTFSSSRASSCRFSAISAAPNSESGTSLVIAARSSSAMRTISPAGWTPRVSAKASAASSEAGTTPYTYQPVAAAAGLATLVAVVAVDPGGGLERLDAILELGPATAGEEGVALPPVDTHLPSFVRGSNEQPDPDRQKLDVEEVHLDVAGDDDALVEHPLEHVGELRRGPTGDAGVREIAGRRSRGRAHASSSTWERR